jgi:hypothetical protein
VVLDQVKGVVLDRVNADGPAGVPALTLRNVEDVTVRNSARLPDGRIERAEHREM